MPLNRVVNRFPGGTYDRRKRYGVRPNLQLVLCRYYEISCCFRNYFDIRRNLRRKFTFGVNSGCIDYLNKRLVTSSTENGVATMPNSICLGLSKRTANWCPRRRLNSLAEQFLNVLCRSASDAQGLFMIHQPSGRTVRTSSTFRRIKSSGAPRLGSPPRTETSILFSKRKARCGNGLLAPQCLKQVLKAVAQRTQEFFVC